MISITIEVSESAHVNLIKLARYLTEIPIVSEPDGTAATSTVPTKVTELVSIIQRDEGITSILNKLIDADKNYLVSTNALAIQEVVDEDMNQVSLVSEFCTLSFNLSDLMKVVKAYS